MLLFARKELIYLALQLRACYYMTWIYNIPYHLNKLARRQIGLIVIIITISYVNKSISLCIISSYRSSTLFSNNKIIRLVITELLVFVNLNNNCDESIVKFGRSSFVIFT